jgi:Icc-related predicted phosphoesterase
MNILVISDLHADFSRAVQACEDQRPELLLCCGDWGDAGEITAADLDRFLEFCPVITTFGNHDDLDLLTRTRNREGSAVLLGQGETRNMNGLILASIGGIWAKSHRLPYYVTDDDVARFARQIASLGPVDILLTHSCPIGLADLTPAGRHGGQRCFLDASSTIAPRLHCCGHLHVPQEKQLKDGRKVINVGATPQGSVAVLDYSLGTGALEGRLMTVR